MIEHIIVKNNVCKDVIDMYHEGDVVGEYPLFIKFKNEKAFDEGV